MQKRRKQKSAREIARCATPMKESDGVDGWFGVAGSECLPSRAIYVVVRAGFSPPVPMMGEITQSKSSRTSRR